MLLNFINSFFECRINCKNYKVFNFLFSNLAESSHAPQDLNCVVSFNCLIEVWQNVNLAHPKLYSYCAS